MKKLFIILIALLLIPITVNAASNDFTTSFDQDKCELHITGTETGHEAQVSYYKNDVFQGIGTDTINNNNFEVVFTLIYDTDTKLKIIVTDENGENEVEKTNINVPACTPPAPTRVNEVFDNQGNSIVINDANVGFDPNDYLDLGIKSKEDIETYLETLKNQTDPNYEPYSILFNKMKETVGTDNELKFYIESAVRDEHDSVIDYSNYNDGFVLNLLFPKDEYKKLNGLKIISVDENTLDKIDDISYTYDEDHEVFIINIDKPGVLLAYIDNSIANTTTNPNTGDNINIYFIVFTISTLGLISLGIYFKKKLFN